MSGTTNKILLIINPNSRSGAVADINDGIALLEAAGYELIQAESQNASDTERLIDQHHNEVQLVVIGGGDGSINSAAAALYRHQLPLAILPLGTANDLAKSLGLPTHLLDIFKLIAEGKKSKIDLGVVDNHYFFNVANMGLGVGVTRELTAEVKKKWGVFSYLKAAFAAFKRNRTFRAVITVDGKPHYLRSIQIAVGNGRYYGGGNSIHQDATIDDGLLHLYSLQPQTLWELLLQAPLLRLGRHQQAVRSYCLEGREITIKTLPLREIYADGEPVSKTPATFKVIPAALTVIRPN